MAVNFIPPNAQRELITCILTNHMKYLLEDKCSSEIKYRRALENCIREFINYEHHANKFSFPHTPEILRKNVKCEYFNALKAAEAWSALSTYAKNLYNQPWRPEFHQIKLYSGFYMHQIESHLSGAELMLEIMGYKFTGNLMVLDEPIDKEILRQVSLDALTAMCECQILFSIYEELAKHLPDVTYAEILKYRETCRGSVEQVIRAFLYCNPANCVDCHMDSSLRAYYPNYGADVRDYSQLCTSATNGYVDNFRGQIPFDSSNGQCKCVRTAKLIDLDDSHEYDSRRRTIVDPSVSGEYRSRSSEQLPLDNNYAFSSDRNFRPQENARDHSCRQSDKENAKSRPNYQQSSFSQSRHHLKSNGVSEALNNISLRPDVEKSDKSKDGSVDRRKQTTKKSNFLDSKKTNAQKKNDRSQSWNCSNCTFTNFKLKDVCEMCSKTRNVTEEAPLESGGKHCKKCTLVNKKEAVKCEACDTDLEDSPTYV